MPDDDQTRPAPAVSQPGDDGRGPGAPRPGTGSRRGRSAKRSESRKQRIKRRIQIAVAALAALFVLLTVFVVVLYLNTEVPTPDQIRTNQTSVVYYADGTTPLARVGEENRTDVELGVVPEHVRNAVLAAENRAFYTDPGISFTGIVRAVWNNLTGGDTQGGSTITQQYVKIAFLTSEQTFARKFQELFMAVKLDNEYSKNQILEWYLNTIYYGRGAHGIQAAAETYFGKNAADLTVAEGAVLAASIRSPALYDPTNHPEAAAERFQYVLDGMVEQGWLDDGERDDVAYPVVLPPGPSAVNQANGPEGLILNQVREELAAIGFDESRLYRDGLRVTTTVSQPAQAVAIQAVNDTMAGQPANLRPALVSVDPATGAVRAYYGGALGTGFDYAQTYRQPGSSFKPFVVAAALERGIGVQARRDGSSPQTFPDRATPVRNYEGSGECGSCPIREALTRSMNTVFYGLAYEVGGAAVADVAHRAGIAREMPDGTPTLVRDGVTASSIGIGEYEVRPIDQAHAFATFAAGGIERPTYFISQIADSQGNILYANDGSDGSQVMAPEIANDVSYALTDVADHANAELEGGRDVACKTGTTQLGDENNKDAWMVGYTPQLSTAVWIGTDNNEPLLTAEGRLIYGAGLPGRIWQAYMNAALAGTEELPLPDEALIKGDTGESSGSGDTPAPTTVPVETSAPPPVETTPPPPPVETTPPPPPTTPPPTTNPPGPPIPVP
ncbi:MAG: penicillin-binding protein [Actinomycetota bacterium]|nr:penicillin-binding protein [Actinomycetota bacterium]